MNPSLSCGAILTVALLAGCAAQGPKQPTPAAMPEAFVVRVGRVEVRALRPETGDRWDLDSAPSGSEGGCDLLAFGGKLVAPVAGAGIKLLCGIAARGPILEKQPSNPDLQLKLSSASGATYQSFVVADALSYNFSYEFVVPTAAIPGEGILLEILDADGEQEPESIASTRLTRDQLATISASPRAVANLGSGAATLLEVMVAPYTQAKVARTQLEAQLPPQLARVRPLMAGELVSLSARGQYSVSSSYDQPIGPSGYPDGKLHSYNFEEQPFTTAAHACGVALVGSHGRVDGAVINTSGRFVVTAAGPLRVGINDKDPSNNRGWIAFEGETRAPSATEWNTGVAAAP